MRKAIVSFAAGPRSLSTCGSKDRSLLDKRTADPRRADRPFCAGDKWKPAQNGEQHSQQSRPPTKPGKYRAIFSWRFQLRTYSQIAEAGTAWRTTACKRCENGEQARESSQIQQPFRRGQVLVRYSPIAGYDLSARPAERIKPKISAVVNYQIRAGIPRRPSRSGRRRKRCRPRSLEPPDFCSVRVDIH